jgi:hypothetical protein
MKSQTRKRPVRNSRDHMHRSKTETNLKTCASDLLQCAKSAGELKTKLLHNESPEDRLSKGSAEYTDVRQLLSKLNEIGSRGTSLVDELRNCPSTSWLADTVERVNAEVIGETACLMASLDIAAGELGDRGSIRELANDLRRRGDRLDRLANKLEQICRHQRCNRMVCKVRPI